MSDRAPLWTPLAGPHEFGATRSDGLVIRVTMNDSFEILRRPGAPTTTHCPCCGSFMMTLQKAMTVADGWWPVDASPRNPEDRNA